MPDISMCKNKTCPKHNDCYRYRAKPNPYRQAYMNFEIEGTRCPDFITIKGWSPKSLKEIENDSSSN